MCLCLCLCLCFCACVCVCVCVCVCFNDRCFDLHHGRNYWNKTSVFLVALSLDMSHCKIMEKYQNVSFSASSKEDKLFGHIHYILNMACGGWVTDKDKREHKDWLQVGQGILITKSGISPLIQYEIEAWHRNLVAHPPLSTCGPCICVPGAPRNCVPCKCNPRRRGIACGSCVCRLALPGCATVQHGKVRELYIDS